MLHRRQFILGLAASLILGSGAYAHWLEPRWLKITRRRVPLPGPAGAAPLRVLHVSDLHLSADVPLSFIEESLACGLAEQPDLIAITGDFVTHARLRERPAYEQVLGRLSAAAPTFACLGNHDGGPWAHGPAAADRVDTVRGMLRQANITCLVNTCAALRIRDRAVQVIGVGDLWSGMCAPTEAFTAAPNRGNAIRIVLNHNPDAKTLLQPFDWDLMLAGHTHGGQLYVPLVGTPFAPVKDMRYVKGLHRWENRWLHISCGIGNLHGVRFNCRPEVNVLDLG